MRKDEIDLLIACQIKAASKAVVSLSDFCDFLSPRLALTSFVPVKSEGLTCKEREKRGIIFSRIFPLKNWIWSQIDFEAKHISPLTSMESTRARGVTFTALLKIGWLDQRPKARSKDFLTFKLCVVRNTKLLQNKDNMYFELITPW